MTLNRIPRRRINHGRIRQYVYHSKIKNEIMIIISIHIESNLSEEIFERKNEPFKCQINS